MSDDLVKRLRVDDPWCQSLCDEAADRIEELEAKLSEVLATAEQAVKIYKQPHYGDEDTMLDHASEAMELIQSAVLELKGDKP